MDRRVAQLVDLGLVRRANAVADGHGLVVALTDSAVASHERDRAPVHMRRVSDLFAAQLDDHELAFLERALEQVILDCAFG